MRVVFVAVGMEQLGVSLLASIVRRAGHTVGLAYARHLFDDHYFLSVPSLARRFNDDDVVEQVGRMRADVVCFSAITPTYRWMLGVAAEVKSRYGVTTVFGGVHPSAVPDTVLEESAVDFVCIGEGDLALPRLLEALARGPVDRPLPNIAYRDARGAVVRGPQLPFFQDLDRLPPFEKDLWTDHIRVDEWYMTMSSRGCPYRCTFCFNNFFANLGGPDRRRAGKYVRQRSVDHFIAELVEAKRRYNIRYVNIEDDIFTLDATWMKEFARRYRKEVGVPFACLSHPHFIDEARAEALREAGCQWVQMGIQSADEEYRHTLKRNDSQRRVVQGVELLIKAGVQVKTDHIFGLPGEAAAAQPQALELYAQHDIGRITTFWLCYAPGTEIIDAGLRAGALTPAQVEETNRGLSTFFFRDRGVADPALRREFLLYEGVFRLLPLLPDTLRRAVQTKHLAWLPDAGVKAVGMGADLLNGLARNNPDLRGYVSQYRLSLENHVRWRLGMAPRNRFGAPPTGPLRDPQWESVWREARGSLDGAAETPIVALRTPASKKKTPMRILLINPTLKGEPEAFHLGLTTIGTYVRANTAHDASVLDFAFHRSKWEKRLWDHIAAFKPDVIGIYISSPYFPSAREVTREIKRLRPDLPILAGGHHPTLAPDAVIAEESIDMLVIGEGEIPTVQLLDALAAGAPLDTVQGLWWKEKGAVRKTDKGPPLEADRIPALDWSLYPEETLRETFHIFGQLSMMGSRGCPYKCSFCAITNVQQLYKGQQFLRFRDPVAIVDEIENNYERYKHLGLRIIYFWDLNFLIRIEWLRKFTDEYRRRGLNKKLPWSAFTRADHVTVEAMECLKDSGCVALRVGIEAANEDQRNRVYEKDLPQEELYEAVRRIKRAGIAITGYFLVGGPGERPEWLIESLEFVHRYGIEYPIFFLYKPLSGTDVVERAAEMGSRVDTASLEEASDFIRGVQMTHKNVSGPALVAFLYLTQIMGGLRLVKDQIEREGIAYPAHLARYVARASKSGFSLYESVVYYTVYGRDHIVDPPRLPIRDESSPAARLLFRALRRVWRSVDGGPPVPSPVEQPAVAPTPPAAPAPKLVTLGRRARPA